MNLDDVLALVHAGFNAQQIAAFAAQPKTAPAAPPAVAPSSAPEQEPETPRTPAPKADVAQTTADTTVIKTAPTMEEITALITGSIDKLSSRIDAMNIRNSEQPKADTVEDILANIINPKTK